VADSATVAEGGTTNVDLASNDVDPEGALDPASITIASGPANGSLVVNADGTVDYTHDGGETTSDSFTYTIQDTAGQTSNTATVSLTVTPANDAPTVVNNSLTLAEGEMVVLGDADLSGSDADGALSSLEFEVANVTAGHFERVGSPGVTITTFTQAELGSGQVRFVHDGGEFAPAYTLTVSDGWLSSAPDAANITFVNMNDAPTLVANAGTAIDFGASQAITSGELSAFDPDNAPGQIVYSVTAPPAAGRLEFADASGNAISSFTQADLEAGRVVYVHGGGFATNDAFSFQISDGAANGPGGTFSLDVASPILTLDLTDVELEVEREADRDATEESQEQDSEEANETDDADEAIEESGSTLETPEEATPLLPASEIGGIGEASRFGFSGVGSRTGTGVDAHATPTTSLEDLEQAWVKPRVHERQPVDDASHRPFVWNPQALQVALNDLRTDLDSEDERRQRIDGWTVQTVEGVAMAVSSSLIASLLRSSSLWAAAMSSMPLWRRVDPLVVLTVSDEERRKMITDLRSAAAEEARVARVLDGGS
jgi:hypothetical protein